MENRTGTQTDDDSAKWNIKQDDPALRMMRKFARLSLAVPERNWNKRRVYQLE